MWKKIKKDVIHFYLNVASSLNCRLIILGMLGGLCASVFALERKCLAFCVFSKTNPHLDQSEVHRRMLMVLMMFHLKVSTFFMDCNRLAVYHMTSCSQMMMMISALLH